MPLLGPAPLCAVPLLPPAAAQHPSLSADPCRAMLLPPLTRPLQTC